MKNHKIFSIKKRLSLSVLCMTLVLLLVSFFFILQNAQHEIEEIYDARLGQTAKLILLTTPNLSKTLSIDHLEQQFSQWMNNIDAVVQSQDEEDDIPSEFGHPYEQKLLFQFYEQQQLLWSSNPAVHALSPSPTFVGFGNRFDQGEHWRIFQLHADPEHYVVVAENLSIRDEMSNEIILSTLLPQLVMIPALLLLLIVLIDQNFQPIDALIKAIALRNPQKLNPIMIEKPTVELSPLVQTLNDLLSQLESAWQREKKFTRMAAHELKTPLTILRLNAENALQSRNKVELEQDLQQILQGIDRTDRLLQQLLTLAKVDSLKTLHKTPLQLQDLLQNILAELAPLAMKNGQTLSLESEPVLLLGDEMLLSVLFRNLVDNAIRYAGSSAEITVKLLQNPRYIDVQVVDNGADIDAQTREKLFDSFYRAQTQKGDGAGLGLSITRDIAALHQATITLRPRTELFNIFLVRFARA